jgi:hypothetical protein
MPDAFASLRRILRNMCKIFRFIVAQDILQEVLTASDPLPSQNVAFQPRDRYHPGF